jgi:hypothetical protein
LINCIIFVAVGVWDAAPLDMELLVQADHPVGGRERCWRSTTPRWRRRASTRWVSLRNMLPLGKTANRTSKFDSEGIREAAARFLRVHPLRAADALQLAAAFAAAERRPASLEIVTLDDRLANAARKEGFAVLDSAEAE